MNLALFDFDGTISTKDSFLDFIQYMQGPVGFWVRCGLLSPRIGLFLAKMYPNHALKQDFLRTFFAGKTEAELSQKAEQYCAEQIPSILRPQAIERLGWHRQQGDTIAVVSACPEFILGPWCRQRDFALLATQLEYVEERSTGRIAGDNCWGDEKVRRVTSYFSIEKFEEVFAYGDSSGDYAMLALATHQFYKPFREKG